MEKQRKRNSILPECHCKKLTINRKNIRCCFRFLVFLNYFTGGACLFIPDFCISETLSSPLCANVISVVCGVESARKLGHSVGLFGPFGFGLQSISFLL